MHKNGKSIIFKDIIVMIIHSCTSYRQSSDNAKLVQASTHRVVGVLMVINKGKCVCVCVCACVGVCACADIALDVWCTRHDATTQLDQGTDAPPPILLYVHLVIFPELKKAIQSPTSPTSWLCLFTGS